MNSRYEHYHYPLAALASGEAATRRSSRSPAPDSRSVSGIHRAIHLLLALFFVIASVPLASSSALAGSFQGLGDLPGGTFQSHANAVSDDGSTVVGYSNSASGQEAFRWTRSGGIVGLGDLPGSPFQSVAFGVSGDGSVVVGGGNEGGGLGDAFRWTSGGGMVGLGDLPGGTVNSRAFGVSSDGSVVVGGSISDSGPPSDPFVLEAFRWTSAGGMVGLGDLPGGDFLSFAVRVSGDGSVIVGYGASASGTEAFRWTSAGGMVGLGDLPGGSFSSYALGVSDDGSTVVGHGSSASGDFEAFRWTSGGGMVALGDLPGGSFFSYASDVSADGSTILGGATSASGIEPFLWDAANGMRSLKDVLQTEYGLDLAGWTLEGGAQFSSDGRTIVGGGINPAGQQEAWIAVVPEPAGGSLLVVAGAGLLARRRWTR
jgi:probable HAF family extracellular repeat protein